jgi:integrase/recombinase XerC
MTFRAQESALSALRSSPEVFAGALDSFRRWLEANQRSLKTVSGYLLATRQFHGFLAAHGLPTRLEQVTAQHVEMWLVSMRSERTKTGAPLRISSINRYTNSLRAFFNWCVAEELVERTPLARIGHAREDSAPPDVLSEDEVRRLFKACEGKDFFARRDLALLRLWFATGIRRAEIAGIRLADVDLDQRVIRVHGKGRRSRDVRIGRRAVVALDRYLRLRSAHHLAETTDAFWLGTRGALHYAGIYAVLQRRAAQAQIRHIYPHLWRHTMAHRYLDAGGGETNLKALMGWSSNAQLQRYGASMIASRARDEYDRLGLDDDL